jgi:hypothetical protein
MIGWIVGGVAVLYFLAKTGVMGASTGSATPTQSGTGSAAGSGSQPSDNAFFLPNDAGVSGNQYTVNVNRQDPNAWKFGKDEIAWMKANIGTHGVSQSDITAVQAKYDQVAKSQSPDAADRLHYHRVRGGAIDTTTRTDFGPNTW